MSEKQAKYYLLGISIALLIVKLLVGSFLELGNDEVYYINYAKNPMLSHFDHPPFVGWVIQISTLNLHLNHDFFVRIGFSLISLATTYYAFQLGKIIQGYRLGFYFGLLISGSIYMQVIAGFFAMPDAGLVLFLFAGLYHFIKAFKQRNNASFIAGSVFFGLMLVTKYHAIYFIGMLFLYLLLFERNWLKKGVFWLGAIIILMGLVPVLFWNIAHDFISFTFHGDRVNDYSHINWNYFLQEFMGGIFYNNPLNWVLLFISLLGFKRLTLENKDKKLILMMGIPLIFIFLVIALFQKTLPHWSGPAYSLLFLFPAAMLSSRKNGQQITLISPAILFIVFIGGAFIIQKGIPFVESDLKEAKNDFTLDLYGWKQLSNEMKSRDPLPIIENKWFPASHYDWYLNNDVYVIGSDEDIHEYKWISPQIKDLSVGSNAYFIAHCRNEKKPEEIFKQFESSQFTDSIYITRNGKRCGYFLLYKLENFNGLD